jgi:hypothetical protein
VSDVAEKRYPDRGAEEAPMYADPADWPINRFVLRVAAMANSIGNTVGNAWITVAGLLAVAGIVGMVGFAVKSSGDISQLATQQAFIQNDLKDVKSDIREIRRGLNDRGPGSTNR